MRSAKSRRRSRRPTRLPTIGKTRLTVTTGAGCSIIIPTSSMDRRQEPSSLPIAMMASGVSTRSIRTTPTGAISDSRMTGPIAPRRPPIRWVEQLQRPMTRVRTRSVRPTATARSRPSPTTCSTATSPPRRPKESFRRSRGMPMVRPSRSSTGRGGPAAIPTTRTAISRPSPTPPARRPIITTMPTG